MAKFGIVALVALIVFWPASAQTGDEKLKPTPLAVNTPADEDEPHVFDGGLSLVFTRGIKEGDSIKEEFMLATRKMAGGPWGKAKVLEDYVSTSGNDRSVFTAGGTYPQYLYFGTTKDKTNKNYDLYVAVRQDKGRAWSAPTPVMNVNTRDDELHPWVSQDGRSLYFSRKSRGGWKQMVSTRTGNMGPGGWQEPKELGLPIGFHHATLMPDGKTMYLEGLLENGRWGLFVSRAEGKGWSKPEELTALNDPSSNIGDRSPNLSRDGRFLYFASDRSGGQGGMDLYYIPTAALTKK
ncbi:MAG: hypothetical protein EBV06_07505 [Planctomycetia bacterium]|nr:hypothetical protein [Planctomycetia bacterium]